MKISGNTPRCSEKLKIIREMKMNIPRNPTLKKKIDKLMAEGLSEDEALDIMVDAWLEYQRNRVVYE